MTDDAIETQAIPAVAAVPAAPKPRWRLIDNAGSEFHRLLSVQLSVTYGAFMGISCVIAAFIPVFNPWILLGISIVVNVALIPLARLVKQEPK